MHNERVLNIALPRAFKSGLYVARLVCSGERPRRLYPWHDSDIVNIGISTDARLGFVGRWLTQDKAKGVLQAYAHLTRGESKPPAELVVTRAELERPVSALVEAALVKLFTLACGTFPVMQSAATASQFHRDRDNANELNVISEMTERELRSVFGDDYETIAPIQRVLVDAWKDRPSKLQRWPLEVWFGNEDFRPVSGMRSRTSDLRSWADGIWDRLQGTRGVRGPAISSKEFSVVTEAVEGVDADILAMPAPNTRLANVVGEPVAGGGSLETDSRREGPG